MDSELQNKNKEVKVDIQEEMMDSQINIEIDEDNNGCSNLQNIRILQQNIDLGSESSVKVENVDYSHGFETMDSNLEDIDSLHSNWDNRSNNIKKDTQVKKENDLTSFLSKNSNIFIFKNADSNYQDKDTCTSNVGQEYLVDVINIKQEPNSTPEKTLELENSSCQDPVKDSSTFDNPKITEERNETIITDNSVVGRSCDYFGVGNNSEIFSDGSPEKGSTRNDTSGSKPDNSHSSIGTTNGTDYDILGQFQFKGRSYGIVKLRLKNTSLISEGNVPPSIDLNKEKMVSSKMTVDLMNKRTDSTTGTVNSGVVLENEHQSYVCSVCKMEFKKPSLLRKHMISHKSEEANQCSVCGKKFKCPSHIRRHMFSHSTERTHPCNICGKLFKTLDGVKGHIKSHNRKRWHRCNMCNKSFEDPDDLKSHMINHPPSTIKLYQCNVCDKTFKHPHNLEQHILSHSTERPYPCRVCGRKFKTLSHLKIHMVSHKTSRQCKPLHQCGVCGKEFKTPSRLRSHVISHSTEQPHQCSWCGKRFKSLPLLRSHMLIHNSENPYLCNVCGKEYKTVSNLRKHMVCHNTERPHLCSVCGKGFKTLSSLKVHMVSHSTERPHLCSVCNKGFKSLTFLRIHMIIHRSNNPYLCKVCGKEYKTVKTLRSHMISHSTERPHLCSVCGKDFKTLSCLKVHMISHSTERPHQCSVCNKRFKTLQPLKSHMIIHSSEHPHQCNVCNQTFKSPNVLSRHRKRKHRTSTSDSVNIKKDTEVKEENELTPFLSKNSNIFVFKNADSNDQDKDTCTSNVGQEYLVDVINIKQEPNSTQEKTLELENSNCQDSVKYSSTFDNPTTRKERNETVTTDNNAVGQSCDNNDVAHDFSKH